MMYHNETKKAIHSVNPIVESPPAHALAWSEQFVSGESSLVRPVIALWKPKGVTAAIGLSQTPAAELNIPVMKREGIHLIRRQSGGGAVLLYDGVLCWEACVSLDALAAGNNGDSGIRQAYAYLSQPIIKGLASMGIEAFGAGICDISTTWDHGLEVRKLAGTAQLRRRRNVLVHGSLLVDPDVDVLDSVLHNPGVQPEYRQGRSHRDFCLTVAEKLGLAREEGAKLFPRLTAAIMTAADSLGWDAISVPERLNEEAAALARRKYLSMAWNWSKIR